ncbi:MAG TPA: hypothetical protein VLF62_03555 [Candidatus Saccharimonadales bacterium]|nr:hypothetical protein [Candidatus Saccharimonadales bacterium]
MTSPEQANPPSLYDALYVGFGNIATRGTVNHGPLDPSLDPGNDGTRTPDGDIASGFDYALSGEALPHAIQEKGIDKVDVWKYACTIVEGEIWPERVGVKIHESIGLTKAVTFHKDAGEITAALSIDLDNDSGEITGLPPDADVIAAELLSGKTHWLQMEGPAGDFARFMHVSLTAPDEPGVDDIKLLGFVLQELEH